MHWQALNKSDTLVFKGVAIVLIVTHNFMHLFPAPVENQFNFDAQRVADLLHLFSQQPENFLQQFLAFFGHFGVQVFIFLSAYGLTLKYADRVLDFGEFMVARLIKIYPTFLLAILLWAMLEGWPEYGWLGPAKILYWSIYSLALKLTLISNFVPGQSLAPVGPWWFIPYIFQFYLLFPFLLRAFARWGAPALGLLSLGSFLVVLVSGGAIFQVNLYFTVVAYLPVSCLGIYLASKDENGLQFPWPLLGLVLLLYLLGNIYQLFWYLSHLCFLLLLLMALTWINKVINGQNIVKGMLVFFGSVSMPLFLVNGFLREPFISWAIDYGAWYMTLLLCLVSLAVSTVVAVALKYTENLLRTGFRITLLERT